MSIRMKFRELYWKVFWKVFPHLPFCRVVSAQNFIVENAYQFIVVEFKAGPYRFHQSFRWSEHVGNFLGFLRHHGAVIETHHYDSRKAFELVAMNTVGLSKYQFNRFWERFIKVKD